MSEEEQEYLPKEQVDRIARDIVAKATINLKQMAKDVVHNHLVGVAKGIFEGLPEEVDDDVKKATASLAEGLMALDLDLAKEIDKIKYTIALSQEEADFYTSLQWGNNENNRDHSS